MRVRCRIDDTEKRGKIENRRGWTHRISSRGRVDTHRGHFRSLQLEMRLIQRKKKSMVYLFLSSQAEAITTFGFSEAWLRARGLRYIAVAIANRSPRSLATSRDKMCVLYAHVVNNTHNVFHVSSNRRSNRGTESFPTGGAFKRTNGRIDRPIDRSRENRLARCMKPLFSRRAAIC